MSRPPYPLPETTSIGRVLVLTCASLLGAVHVVDAQNALDTFGDSSQSPPLIIQASALAAASGVIDDAGVQPSAGQAPGQPSWVAERRACEGCAPRSVGKALFQTTIINVLYETANLIRGQVTAHITPKTWWANMEQGWVWDLDDFAVNQVGHPYQGNNYFNTGRANGLSFYESAAITAFGSATWEYYGETNHASLNDFINTTLGGIALGEMFHRTAWLVRDTRATGGGRLWSEIGATVLDPITGANRFITGDASRVTDTPPDLVPSNLTAFVAAGVLWRGDQSNAFSSNGQAFLELDGIYGSPEGGRSRTPYDAFALRLRFGGGRGLSEARVRGRLLGEPFNNDGFQFSVVQSYDYQFNDAYSIGAQSFDATVGIARNLSSTTSMWLMAWGGLTVLGAVDSLPAGVTEVPEEEEAEGTAGQGVSEGPRYYDYGPGSNFGATAIFRRGVHPFTVLTYEGRQLYSLDGVRANHFLQRARLDVIVPVRGSWGVLMAAEYFDRRTFYQDPAETSNKYHYPQARVAVTWGAR